MSRTRGILRRVPWVIAAAIVTTLLGHVYILQPFRIVSGSMKPGLSVGDSVLVYKLAFLRTPPQRGDIVAIHDTETGAILVKRVIGLPGERVEVRVGLPVVNHEAFRHTQITTYVEPYRFEGPEAGYPICENHVRFLGDACRKRQYLESPPGSPSYPVLYVNPPGSGDFAAQDVPAREYFLLGDNRDNSADSRLPRVLGGIGMVAEEAIIGKVILSFRLPSG